MRPSAYVGGISAFLTHIYYPGCSSAVCSAICKHASIQISLSLGIALVHMVTSALSKDEEG